MKSKPSKQIPLTKSEWKGKEILHRTDRLNVKLRVNPKKPDEKLFKKACEELRKRTKGAGVHRATPKTGKLVLTVPEGTDIVALATELSKRPDIVYVEPDQIGTISVTPNDSQFADQWALATIQAEAAWNLETGKNHVLVGILDTGISHEAGNLTHPDLNDAGRYILGTDFVNDDAVPQDGHGHGTHVAGTAAAETDNASGIAGLNWVSQVYVCKVFDDFGNGSESDFEAAAQEIVDFAVANNLKAVINLSAGWFTDSETLSDACDYVNSHGMLLCVAGGNEGSDLRSPAIHSVNFNGVIAVGATDSGDVVADFSNVGPEVTVVAPGVEILSTFPTYDVNGDTAHDFVEWDGTSMACPHVTGLASLVWSRVSQLTNEQVRDVLVNTAVKLGAGDFDNAWGNGRIHAGDAVAMAGWELTPVQTTMNFVDIPEGETQLRAVRIDVKSFHATTFEVTVLPGAPFSMHNYSGPVTIGKTTDYDTPREVYLWIKYTGTSDGDTASGSAQVTCTTTGEVFDIAITANTITRPSVAMMLVLDKSGSMTAPSGVGSMTRERVLKFSANIFMNYVREGNGVGIVAFDQDAFDLLNPVAGPFGAPDDPFDTERAAATTALSLYAANPMGMTAIGDGIERGHNNLIPASAYDKKAMIVFTDGHETESKYIADVSSLIDEQVFAVGLGTAQELNPNALNEICNGSGGYLLLTDELDNDDTFKLAKYFLQIQAGVNNEQVVVDPDGYVGLGQTVKIPFKLNEADISCDAIALVPAQGIIEVGIETPQGDIIDASNVASFPTVTRFTGPNLTCYRMSLPVRDGAAVDAHTGTWHLLLRINRKYYKRYLDQLESQQEQAAAHGLKYTGLIHAYSNLRMNCTLTQNSYEPGAGLHLRAVISEYGVPLEKTASVRTNLIRPDGSSSTIVFSKVGTGAYEAEVDAHQAGIYRFTVQATGFTSRNAPFTREQVLTAPVWRGGNNQPPTSTDNPNSNSTLEAICKLLHCLDKSTEANFKERLKKEGLYLDRLLTCFCKERKGDTKPR